MDLKTIILDLKNDYNNTIQQIKKSYKKHTSDNEHNHNRTDHNWHHDAYQNHRENCRHIINCFSIRNMRNLKIYQDDKRFFKWVDYFENKLTQFEFEYDGEK